MYSVNFTVTRKKNCLSLHYNEANSYLFVNGTEIIKFKAKDSEMVAIQLCLGNISKDWPVDNMEKTWLIGFVYDFSADDDAIAVNDILDIQLLNEKEWHSIIKCLGLLKSVFFYRISIFIDFNKHK